MGTHPEAVKVEDVEWDVVRLHAVDVGHDAFLVVVGEERRRQPESVRPVGGKSSSPGELGVRRENLLGRRADKDIDSKAFPGHRHLHLGHLVRLDFERYVIQLVDEDTVVSIGEVEWDTLVCCSNQCVSLQDSMICLPESLLEPPSSFELSMT